MAEKSDGNGNFAALETIELFKLAFSEMVKEG